MWSVGMKGSFRAGGGIGIARIDRENVKRTAPVRKLAKAKWGLLLPGAPGPRLTLLRRQGFDRSFKPRYAA